ncbi:MAG: peptidylprolyl isomerase [Candidatus Nanoarchaeia archaeon]|nr:peptidylprolyl isomerase [Candidatus Nanoarchaeia archaeon]MDD5740866.1 peptidylprolyl isomerase [Candidatus Nanoarchaeia archaeon]
MTTVQKNDFIEIEFTGKANNEIFDTTHKEEAKKIGIEADVKPIIVSVGNEMLLKGLDKNLEGKEIAKQYSIKLAPEEAFGKRNPSLIKTIPIKVFREKNMNPVPGLTLQMDNYLTKILSVSGGRVTVDFNNPLAGKEIEYDFKILKKVEDIKEKINALQDFFFRNRFEFTINETDKKIILKEEKILPFLQIFQEKFKEILGYGFEIFKEDKKEKKQEDRKIEIKPAAPKKQIDNNKNKSVNEL